MLSAGRYTTRLFGATLAALLLAACTAADAPGEQPVVSVEGGDDNLSVYVDRVTIPRTSPGLVVTVHPRTPTATFLVEGPVVVDRPLSACPVYVRGGRTGEPCTEVPVGEDVAVALGHRAGDHVGVELTSPGGAARVGRLQVVYEPRDRFLSVELP